MIFRHFVGVQWSFVAITLIAVSSAANAGPGHDHGDEKPSAAAVAASPRLQAHSDDFELVGILANGVLTVYLDDYATNAPIANAQITYEIGAEQGAAKPQPDGTYRIESALLQSGTGTLPFSFAIDAGGKSDLLAAELTRAAGTDSHNPGHDHDHSHTQAYAIGGALLALLLGVASWIWRKRRASRGVSTLAVLAAIGLSAAMLAPQPVWAGPGHDHGDEAPAASGNSPQRLPDGSVFLPKPSQRQLDVRTALAAESAAPKAFTLNARVVADPAAMGKVQATQAGRLEAARLPSIGDRVAKGQVLAVVRPSVGAIERANQAALGAELASSLDLAKRKLARLEQLEGTVPQRDIEAARAEVQSLTTRNRTVGASLGATEILRAPVGGVVAAVNASVGQVVEAREAVFEIIDPSRLLVEAQVFEPALAARIQSATLNTGDKRVELQVMGAGRVLREGALPVLFRLGAQAAASLAVGQPVVVYANSSESVKGIVVPAAAVVKNPSNQPIVWTHDTAERFIALPVTTEVLDAQTVVITSGLQAGARVVVQGASLVNQVR